MHQTESIPDLNKQEDVPDLRRVTQLWRYITIATFVWFAFAIVHRSYGVSTASIISIVEAIACLALLASKPFVKRHIVLICHLFLMVSLIGVVAISIRTGSAHRETVFFLPLLIFVANQTMGCKRALLWTAFICSVVILRHVFTQHLEVAAFEPNKNLVNVLIFSGAVFFLCQQSEHLFNQRTLRLRELSSQLQRQNRRVHYLAKTDPLTGLSNRYGLSEFCADRIDAKDGAKELTMLSIDFNKFKEVNDTVGHQVGDELLQEIGLRLQAEIQDDAFIVRLGGDEFCILIPDISCEETAIREAREIHRKICMPYTVRDQKLTLGASIGISLYPMHSTDMVELLTYADTAMYKAKFSDQDCVVYTPSMMDQIRDSHELRDKLTEGLDRSEFHLVYQPQVCFETNQVFGCEALIRWNHNGEEIFPNSFMIELETSGKIIEVGRWIIEEACRQLGVWQSKGYHYAVSVNVSAKQFADANFVEQVRKSIEHHDVDPSLLDFEITESILIEDFAEAIDKLNALKAMGCSISIDDFGTGYSSLAYLKRLPIDRLKIDREFVKDFPDADDGLVASSVIALAQALDIRVLAEGVETPQQHQFLFGCGCEEYQGYLCSEPISAEDCETRFFKEKKTSKQDSPVNA